MIKYLRAVVYQCGAVWNLNQEMGQLKVLI